MTVYPAFAEMLGWSHVRDVPLHPQAQGKI